MSKTRWGILSTGRIAHQFAQDVQKLDDAVITAVTSRTKSTAARFAQKYEIENLHSDFASLLEDSAVDAVYIATPNTLHYQNTLDALAMGKAVLCEKPLTVSVEEAHGLARAAADNHVYLMEAMWTWFLPAIQTAIEWVQAGRIGALKHIKADFGYPQLPYDPIRREYNAELGGGCLLDMGIYPVALAWLLTGRDPLSIKTLARQAPNGVEDDLSMLFDYGDVTANLATSFRCKLQNWAYIVGEEGYIAIPDFWRAGECHFYDGDILSETYCDERSTWGLGYEVAAVQQDLREGKVQSDVVTLNDSIAFQRLIERIRKTISADQV